jgi:sulfate transport system permease protein
MTRASPSRAARGQGAADRGAVAYVALMLLLPLGAVLAEGASQQGWQVWLAAVTEPDARAAIKLTLLVAAISVPLNTVFGVAAAWAIAKFDFRGKTAAGRADRAALFGLAGRVGPVFVCCSARRAGSARGSRTTTSEIIFALPGLVLATVFVTFPFVARQLIPLMTAQGRATRKRR